MKAQTGIEDDEDVGETSPLNVRADGGKFMEEFFDQVKKPFFKFVTVNSCHVTEAHVCNILMRTSFCSFNS